MASSEHTENSLCSESVKCEGTKPKDDLSVESKIEDSYKFDGKTYLYTDEATNITYKWDISNNTWITNTDDSVENITTELKDEESEIESDDENENTEKKTRKNVKRLDMSKGQYGFENNTHTYTDPSDGTVYFWDSEKNAWFPKIDDNFMAYYQMSYGFIDNTQNEDKFTIETRNEEKESVKKEEAAKTETTLKRKAPPEPPKWFDLSDDHNTKVYVSNLPLDITESEFVDLMQKCGLVMKDIDTGKMKIKLYMDPGTKELKGDALCTYIKKESVDLALKLLDGYDVRGKTIKVEKAQFQMKGDAYDPSLKPKKKRRKDKEKMKKIQEKLFAWQPDKIRGERAKCEKVVVVKNLFEPSMFDENLGLILEYQQDIREECSKCGAVKKVVVYDKHKDGVAQIWFKEADAADACVKLLNNRWFGQRKITAETWDGKTKYRMEETPEETEARLKKWENYLNANKEENTNKEKNNVNDATDKGNVDEKQTPSLRNEEDKLENYESDDTRSSAGSGDETDEESNRKDG